jgi:hypothetical protein
MPLVSQRGGEAVTKATHRWKHIGRGNDRGLSPLNGAAKKSYKDRK